MDDVKVGGGRRMRNRLGLGLRVEAGTGAGARQLLEPRGGGIGSIFMTDT